MIEETGSRFTVRSLYDKGMQNAVIKFMLRYIFYVLIPSWCLVLLDLEILIHHPLEIIGICIFVYLIIAIPSLIISLILRKEKMFVLSIDVEKEEITVPSVLQQHERGSPDVAIPLRGAEFFLSTDKAWRGVTASMIRGLFKGYSAIIVRSKGTVNPFPKVAFLSRNHDDACSLLARIIEFMGKTRTILESRIPRRPY